MFELLFLTFITAYVFCWTKDIFFTQPKAKSAEEKIGEAITKYLEEGLIVRTKPEKDKSK